ncbi:hypothetical protein [Chroococcidiopsis sp.]
MSDLSQGALKTVPIYISFLHFTNFRIVELSLDRQQQMTNDQ